MTTTQTLVRYVSVHLATLVIAGEEMERASIIMLCLRSVSFDRQKEANQIFNLQVLLRRNEKVGLVDFPFCHVLLVNTSIRNLSMS